ncbi:MAG: hypothetical protein HY906_08360 [Deltaproteobacteria bacterium]|nr:hypothetical protein [Deltaproteobacteria bacterium]
MKPTSLFLAAVLLVAPVAYADEATPSVTSASRGRSWLTGLGLGLSGAGVMGLMLGVASLLSAGEANALLKAYYPDPTSAPTTAEAPAVKRIEDRRDAAMGLAVPSLVLGGAALVGGIVCVALDGVLGGGPQVALVPTPGGGAVVVSGEF